MSPDAILTCIGACIGAATLGFAFGYRSGVASTTATMELKLHLREMEHRGERLKWVEKEEARDRKQ